MRQIELMDAYVVRVQPWGETSLRYRLVVRKHGWVNMIHRGARSGKNACTLPSLTPVRVSWSGRGNLPTLQQCEVAGAAVITGGARQIYALYVNEILSYLLPQDRASDEMYPIYQRALESLRTAPDPESVLRGIELDLLSLAGHAVALEHTDDGPVEAEVYYRYRPGAMPQPVPDSEVELAQAQDLVVRGAVLLALQRRDTLAGRVRQEARQLMRHVMDHHVAPHVIRTRHIMQVLK